MGQSTQTASRPRPVAAVHGGFQSLGDLLPIVMFEVLRAQQGSKTGVYGASLAVALPHCAGGGVQPIDKQEATAHQAALHDGAAQAADRGTRLRVSANGGGGNPVSCDGGVPGSRHTRGVRGTAGQPPAEMRFSVVLPEYSRSVLPSDLHVRRFAHVATFDSYLRVWSAAGFDIQFDGPHSAFLAKHKTTSLPTANANGRDHPTPDAQRFLWSTTALPGFPEESQQLAAAQRPFEFTTR